MIARPLLSCAALLALTVPAASTAQVPPSPVNIVGKVISTAPRSVTLQTDHGTVTVAMSPNWTVDVAHVASVSDLKPGEFIATTNTNIDPAAGRALEVRIFEPGYEPEHGTHPIPKPATSMTHGTVASVTATSDGVELVVTYPSGSRNILVPSQTKVTAYDLRPRNAAGPGTLVSAVTRKGADGVPTAGRLTLVNP